MPEKNNNRGKTRSAGKAAGGRTAGKRKTTGKDTGQQGSSRRRPVQLKPQQVSPEEYYRMIAESAYYIAERRGFHGGDPEQDWLQAEMEIRARFAA